VTSGLWASLVGFPGSQGIPQLVLRILSLVVGRDPRIDRDAHGIPPVREKGLSRFSAPFRKQFAMLLDDAAKRKFDCVVFWALDRFSREGMAQTIAHLQRLNSCGVSFHSYTEPHLSTDNELVRNILLALLSSLAKVEAQKISDRTKAGMARAKAKGIKIGRPRLGVELRQKIAQRTAKGETPYTIAKALGIDRHTAAKYAS
jgi:DNA invertase Pin-like site-specific DNA recombinase